MSSGAHGKKWYERTGLVTGIGVLIGIVFGLGRNDLIFGIVMGFFLGAGVPIGAIGSRWYRRRQDGEGNMIVMAIVFAVVIGAIVALVTAGISGILDSITDFVKSVLSIALDQASSLTWGVAIGIGVAVGAGLSVVLGKKDRSGS